MRNWDEIMIEFVPKDEEEQHCFDEHGSEIPLFSEMFLYSRVGKDTARDILGMVRDYEKNIQKLEAIRDYIEKWDGKVPPVEMYLKIKKKVLSK